MKLHWLLSLFIMAYGCFASASRPKGDPMVVSDFPEPPQQHAPWDGATNTISDEFNATTKLLFEQGLADPRGCDYREIEIKAGELGSETAETIKTHGWVLPASSSTNQTFAVCWNGLVYPVVSASGAASLSSDVDSLIAGASTNASRSRLVLSGRAFRESLTVAPDSILPVKACLLLRLGEKTLATQVWNACEASSRFPNGQPPADASYRTLAGDWAWSLFDRMICAHMRRDISLALVSAHKLMEIQPKVEAALAKSGAARPPNSGNGMQPSQEQPYLTFLDQLPQVTADLERRARTPKQKNILEMGLTNFPGQSERITALIEDLDLVSARQMGQPGWVVFEMDPIVEALIKEGDASVEPLLDCLEHDQRLTCSVGFGRDFFRQRHVLPVASAAKAALQKILQTQFENAAEIRAYWKQNKGLKLEDRWYQVLRDDKIGEEQTIMVTPAGGQGHIEKMVTLGQGPWMQTARIIVESGDERGIPNFRRFSSKLLPIGEKPKLRGEVLRGRSNPSVTELLTKQADFVVEQANQTDQSPGVDAIRVGTELVLIIQKWERNAAARPARGMARRAIQLFGDPNSFIMSSGPELARSIPELTEIRVEGGDTNALPEYAAWIRTASEEDVGLYAVDAFEPLWLNPNDPTVSAVSQWLFNDPASPWSKLPWPRVAFQDPLDSDLVKLPAFRLLLARELENQSIVGSMQWAANNGGMISYNLSNSSGGFQVTWPNGESPADGTKVEVRRCDWIGWSLSQSKQIDFFNPFAPIEKRDEAIKNAKTRLAGTK
jgi:hypothetical protein